MDISLNLIDLQYLTNPIELNKLLRNKNLSSVSMADLNFYKNNTYHYPFYFSDVFLIYYAKFNFFSLY